MSVNSKMTALADAVREKCGGTELLSIDEMAEKVSSFGSGETIISDGTVITLSGSEYITIADCYTSGIVKRYQFNLQYATSITWHGFPTYINPYGFYKCGDCSGLDFSHISSMGEYSFSGAGKLGNVSLPLCSAISGSAHFWECSSLSSISVPKLRSIPLNSFGRCTGMTSCQIGSVGYGITSIANNAFNGTTQRGLTITAYTAGTYADICLANIRNTATNATIIIKASEDTLYNGVAYSAGNTIIKSTV